MPINNNPNAAAMNPAVAAPQPAVDPKMEMEAFLESISTYNKFGKALKRDTTLAEIGQQLAQIAEMAEMAVMNETGDWFDQHTVKRNMKEIKSYSGDFMKLATEADAIHQRMTAYYDDMGRILERYFELPDVVDPMHQADPEHVADGLPQTQEVPGQGEPQPLKESEPPAFANSTAKEPEPSIYRATPLPDVKAEFSKMDELTLRAIKAVHARLKKTNPEMAKKFAELPPQKMQQVVWRLVK